MVAIAREKDILGLPCRDCGAGSCCYDPGIGYCESVGWTVERYFPYNLPEHANVPDCHAPVLSGRNHVATAAVNVYAPDGTSLGEQFDQRFAPHHPCPITPTSSAVPRRAIWRPQRHRPVLMPDVQNRIPPVLRKRRRRALFRR